MYQTTEPARYWQDQLVLWGPKILFAILILIITHFVAKAVQWGVAKLVDRMPVLKRHPAAGGDSVGTELGRLAYWLIWLVGLIAALQPLGLSGVLTPVTALTNEVFGFLPRLLGAGLFFFAGLILARIVRHIVEAALGALNLERLAGRAGLKLGEAPVAVDSEGTATEGAAPVRSTIARAVGMTVSAVIIIFAAIASLDILQIEAVSEPAKNMLNMIALAIPNVLAALLWLAIAFLIAKWVKSLIETVLPSLGFDNFVHALGAMPRNVSPSKVAGAIAMTALLLLAGIEALRQPWRRRRRGPRDSGHRVGRQGDLRHGDHRRRLRTRPHPGRPGRGIDRQDRLCRDDRQIFDHRTVHRDRPDLHGIGRPDRDAGVRPDPGIGGGGDGDCLRPRRTGLCGEDARGMA